MDKKQFITRTFHEVPNDKRTYVLYGRAPNRAIALQVKAACEEEGTDVYVTKGVKHHYIWVELAWMYIDTVNIAFVPDSSRSLLVYTTT